MVDSSTSEALLFFTDRKITKEMTYAEFQAILDSYVPLHDLANRLMHVVYVRINSRYHVTAAVFFQIPFDKEGFIEKSWNIPLQQLADGAAKGPNLGSGPIALACYSQCPLKWHRNNLWDPVMQAPHNDFVPIKKTIKNNGLGIIFKKIDEDNKGNQYNEERTRAALIIKEQRLRQKLLSTKSEQDMRQLSLDHQERLLAYQQQLNDYQQQLNEQRELNLELKEIIAGQTDKISGMRDYYENKLRQAQTTENDDIRALKEHYESQILHEVQTQFIEHQAELKSRDVELLYRSERESQLQQEILKFQDENKRLVEMSSGVILDRLAEAGVNFVIYHPGAGHLTIQAKDVGTYLANSTAYVAKHCGVNERLYRIWLDHFYTPTCQYELDNGELCDQPVIRLNDPSQFIVGESDCCLKHQAKTPSIVNISKNGRFSANKI